MTLNLIKSQIVNVTVMVKGLIVFCLSYFFTSSLMAQDIIVKKDGTILNVYNLEESASSYFYSLEPSKSSSILKIEKEEVFSIKKANGASVSQTSHVGMDADKKNERSHEDVTAEFVVNIKNKKYSRCFTASTPDGHKLDYAVLSEADKTLTVIKGEYHEQEYVIPEYVRIDGDLYTVTEIDEKGFYMEFSVKNVQFPNTLKKIGKKAFFESCLRKIILPESLEEIGNMAFYGIGGRNSASEIYLPSSLNVIGLNCFLLCGPATSFRGYCQAYFSNMPKFITEGTCKQYGIDEEAVRAFYKSRDREK